MILPKKAFTCLTHTVAQQNFEGLNFYMDNVLPLEEGFVFIIELRLRSQFHTRDNPFSSTNEQATHMSLEPQCNSTHPNIHVCHLDFWSAWSWTCYNGQGRLYGSVFQKCKCGGDWFVL